MYIITIWVTNVGHVFFWQKCSGLPVNFSVSLAWDKLDSEVMHVDTMILDQHLL